jgi:hypothetical protein
VTESCRYSYRDARFGRLSTAPRFRLHFFDMRNRPCVFSIPPQVEEPKRRRGSKVERGDFLVWGLTAGVALSVAEAALGRPPSFEVSPPRAPPYNRICCFRDRMPTVMAAEGDSETGTGKTTVKKRTRN